MKINQFPKEFSRALPILEKIQAADYEAYFVGGCVRDFLLDHPIHDVDIASSATPLEIASLFTRTFDLGIEHGTIAIIDHGETYEITTFRTESGYQDFRRPDEVVFVRSLAEDLKRRDFTMNALAVSTEGELIDLFAGLSDIDAQIIRAVGNPEERFFEDALRMMRGVRFASQLGFKIEDATFQAMIDHRALLKKIAVERIRVEFEKMLTGAFASFGLNAFLDSGLFEYTPLLNGQHAAIMRFKNRLKHIPVLADERLMWTILMSELPEELQTRQFLRAWKLSNEAVREISILLDFLKIRLDGDLSDLKLYELGDELAGKLELLMPYYGKEQKIVEVAARFADLPIQKRQDLAVDGRDLLAAFDLKAGAWLGESLAQAEQMVVTRIWPNEKDALLKNIREDLVCKKILS